MRVMFWMKTHLNSSDILTNAQFHHILVPKTLQFNFQSSFSKLFWFYYLIFIYFYLSCSTGFEPVNLSLFYSRSRIVQMKGCQSQSGGNEAPFKNKRFYNNLGLMVGRCHNGLILLSNSHRAEIWKLTPEPRQDWNLSSPSIVWHNS